MRISRLRRLSSLLLTSGIVTSCLIGCVDRPAADYSWVQPIYLQPETTDWLVAHEPWPESLWSDLNKIDKHNKKVEAIIGQSRN